MKRFKLSTEVLFSEDAIDALLEEKDENAVLITDKFMVDSGMADIILKKLSNCKEVSVFSEVVPCFLYISPSPRDKRQSRMPSSA